MATTTKIAEPARVGHWGLTVDDMAQPTEWVVVRYPDEGKRHSDPHHVVRRLPYVSDPRAALTEIGMPMGTATTLVFQVEMKRASPKAADADSGYRPVS